MEIIGDKGALEVKAFAQVNRLYDAQKGVIEDIVWNADGDEGLVAEFVDVCRTGSSCRMHPDGWGKSAGTCSGFL